MASLLGTGVMLTVLLTVDMELDFVVSLRHCDMFFWAEDTDAGDGLAPEAPGAAALEKKPRMLRCLPVDPDWLEADLAGVRTAAADLPVIFLNARGVGADGQLRFQARHFRYLEIGSKQ